MKCDRCEKEAVMHMTQVVNEEMKEIHLCQKHAIEQGLDLHTPVSITEILMGLSGSKKELSGELGVICPRCTMAREEFCKNGRLGCPECYKTFMAELTMAIKAMHHSGQHLGKIPARAGIQTQTKSKIARLQKEIEDAVAREDFEKAAQLRDQIKTCRNEPSVAKKGKA